MFTLKIITAPDVLVTTGLSQAQLDTVTDGIQLAASAWGRYTQNLNAVIDLELDFEDLPGSTLAQAGAFYYSTGGGPFKNQVIEELNGNTNTPSFEGNTFDASMTIDLPSVTNGSFFYETALGVNARPGTRFQTDFLTLAQHELGHALGFNDFDYGNLSDGQSFFGSNAVAVNGGAVALSDGTHLTGSGELMSAFITDGTREYIAPIHTALMRDVGLDIVRSSDGNDTLYGYELNDDVLSGFSGTDQLFGLSGNDTLIGGLQNDFMDGGAGEDTGLLRGLNGGGFDLVGYNGDIFALDKANRSNDHFVSVEKFGADGQFITAVQVGVFDGLAYLASYDDLANAFSTDSNKSTIHYLTEGFFEAREITFDASQYLSNFADLASAFGGDTVAATSHFITNGLAEGRLAENPLDYVASFADLIANYGGPGTGIDELRTDGLDHYRLFGSTEGRRTGIDFDPQSYLNNWSDLEGAFGADADSATIHYINYGFFEGRLAVDALQYIAANNDLTGAASSMSNDAIQDFARAHWTENGRFEGRSVNSFSADDYLANYDNLRTEFADGTGGYDETAATLHYIQVGYEQGLTDDLLIV